MAIDSQEHDSLFAPKISQNVPPPDTGGQGALRVQRIFRFLMSIILLAGILAASYCVFASKRYVSEAIIIIQNTEQIATPSLDLSAVLGGLGGANATDQLLLREHLLSVDMLKKLDEALDLRSHYSDKRHDFISRLWFKNCSIEWFHWYYLLRVEVTYDDYSQVLRISAQAYDTSTAEAIAASLVHEGERFMNEMSHELARGQLDFLEKQVAMAHDQVLQASKDLLDFQNRKGLASPKVTVESINAVLGKLEAQRTEVQTQLASLPHALATNHPTKVSLRQSLQAVEAQIARERAKLASTKGNTLNTLVEEEQRLELELQFKQDLYKSSLVGLEKGRMDAARTLKQVSVLQKPVLPEYAMKPRRIYGLVTVFCVTLLILGIVNLLKYVILDHVD